MALDFAKNEMEPHAEHWDRDKVFPVGEFLLILSQKKHTTTDALTRLMRVPGHASDLLLRVFFYLAHKSFSF
jgi:hypothetical protein